MRFKKVLRLIIGIFILGIFCNYVCAMPTKRHNTVDMTASAMYRAPKLINRIKKQIIDDDEELGAIYVPATRVLRIECISSTAVFKDSICFKVLKKLKTYYDYCMKIESKLRELECILSAEDYLRLYEGWNEIGVPLQKAVFLSLPGCIKNAHKEAVRYADKERDRDDHRIRVIEYMQMCLPQIGSIFDIGILTRSNFFVWKNTEDKLDDAIMTLCEFWDDMQIYC